MNYAENIQACEAGGHDMSEARTHVTKAAPTHKPEPPVLVTLDISEVASAIDGAIAPLEARLDDLEARIAALESAAGAKHSKPVLRVAAGGRQV